MLELLATLVGLALICITLVFPIIALVRARRAARLGKRNEQSWQSLSQRVHVLEAQLKEVQARLNQQSGAAVLGPAMQKSAAPPEGPAPILGTAKDAPLATGGQPSPAEASRTHVPLADAPPALNAPPAPPEHTFLPPRPLGGEGPGVRGSRPEPPSAIPQIEKPAATAVSPRTSPLSADIIASPSADKVPASTVSKRALNIEEVLGKDWLNKLGMVSLIVGLALLMAREMREFGPLGKVLAGFFISAALMGAGFFFERRERWRTLARAAMGGGWALLYFTTYAMNHIDAARVLKSEAWDFVLLIIVAGAIVAHTLRYHSRVVSGLAFLLAFSTINISHAGATSLVASAILAVALVLIVGRRRWFDLEVLAIVAIFLNHYFWLRPIIEPMGAHHHPFPELVPSTLLLLGYWLIFRVSYIYRRIDAQEEENVSTVAALLNTFLFHGLIKYQSVHPELAFWFLVSVGTVELALGQLPLTRRRRTAFVILSTLGATLLVAAFPYRYSGGRLSIIWLAEAEALFLAGVFSREILFRWLGIAVETLVACHMFFVDIHRLDALREIRATDFSDPRRSVMFVFAALIIFANAFGVPRRWPDLLKPGFEQKFYRIQTYLGGVLLLAFVWAVCPEPWVAAGFAGCALLLAFFGARGKIDELTVLANVFVVLGLLRVLFANFAVVEVAYFNVRAVVSICLAVALLYAAARWISFPLPARRWRVPDAYIWVATFVVALLAWYQLWPASVVLGWALIGLVLFALGLQRRSTSLRLQSYVLFAATFLRLFVVNFNAPEMPGVLSPRLYTALPLALLFYLVYARLSSGEQKWLTMDHRLYAAELHCFLGTIALAALMRFELPPDWVAGAWSAMVCVFVLMAWRYGRRVFLGQALLVTAAVFFRTLLHNFYERTYFPSPSIWMGGWMTVGTTVVLLAIALLVARRLKRPRPPGDPQRRRVRKILQALEGNPQQAFFFVAFVLLTGLLYVELRAHGLSTVAWGVEAVGVFLFALAVKERSFRLSALVLLLVCVGKIVFADVWGLTPLDRDLTFIVLGVALFSVSFLYTRYPEVLKAYL